MKKLTNKFWLSEDDMIATIEQLGYSVEGIDADYVYISYYADECEFPIEERIALIRANNTIAIK